MEEKIDGAWYQLEKTAWGEVYLFGRTKSKVTGEYTEKIANVPHIKEWAERHLPNATTLIGEIYVPGGKSNDVSKIMGCTPENACRRQYEPENFNTYGGPIHYYIFDIIRYAGKDICNEGAYQRYRYLEIDLEEAFWDNEYVELAPIFEDNFEEHLKDIFAAGGEGAVFKKKDCPYRPGKRTTTSQMYKYKTELETLDVICLGFEKPTYYYQGKEPDTWPYHNNKGELITKFAYYNYPAAIKMGLFRNNQIIEVGTVSSGLTDELRENIRDYPEQWINTVIECKAMSTSKDSAFRHCVFIQKREDKDIKECIYEEIFG